MLVLEGGLFVVIAHDLAPPANDLPVGGSFLLLFLLHGLAPDRDHIGTVDEVPTRVIRRLPRLFMYILICFFLGQFETF